MQVGVDCWTSSRAKARRNREILDYEKWEIQEMREGCEFYRTLEISTLNDFYLLFYFSFSFFVHLETQLQVANF